jgi:hypothetical protein
MEAIDIAAELRFLKQLQKDAGNQQLLASVVLGTVAISRNRFHSCQSKLRSSGRQP